MKKQYILASSIFLLMASLALLAAACDSKTTSAVISTPPPITTNPIADIEPDQINPDNLEEFNRIFDELDTKLRDNESDTFGGSYQSGPATVVLFTTNGDQIIRKYVPDEYMPFVRLMQSPNTLVQLETIQSQSIAAISKLGIKADSQVDLLMQRVIVYVAAADKVKIDNFKKDGSLSLSYNVDVMDIANKLADEAWLQ
jgi:hypothetical protein